MSKSFRHANGSQLEKGLSWHLGKCKMRNQCWVLDSMSIPTHRLRSEYRDEAWDYRLDIECLASCTLPGSMRGVCKFKATLTIPPIPHPHHQKHEKILHFVQRAGTSRVPSNMCASSRNVVIPHPPLQCHPDCALCKCNERYYPPQPTHPTTKTAEKCRKQYGPTSTCLQKQCWFVELYLIPGSCTLQK